MRKQPLAPPSAAAIITGTCAAGTDTLYASPKIVAATDARILSGADFAVPVRAVFGMLSKS